MLLLPRTPLNRTVHYYLRGSTAFSSSFSIICQQRKNTVQHNNIPRTFSVLAFSPSSSSLPSSTPSPPSLTNVPSSSSSSPSSAVTTSSILSSSSSSSTIQLVHWLRNNGTSSNSSLSIFQCIDRIHTLSPSLLIRYIHEYLGILSVSSSTTTVPPITATTTSSSSNTITTNNTLLTINEWQTFREAFFLWLQDQQVHIGKDSFLTIQDINSLTYILSSSVMYMFNTPNNSSSSTTSNTTTVSQTPTTTASSSSPPSVVTNTKMLGKRRSDTLLMNMTAWKQITFALCQRILRYYETTLSSSSSSVSLTSFHLHLWYISLRLLTMKRIQYPEYAVTMNRYISRAFDNNPVGITVLPISAWSDIIGTLSFTGDRTMMEKVIGTFRQLTETKYNDIFLNYMFQNKYKDSNEYLISYYRSVGSATTTVLTSSSSVRVTEPIFDSSSQGTLTIKDKNGLASFHALTWMLKRSFDGGMGYTAITDGLLLVKILYPYIEKIMDTVFLPSSSTSSSSSSTSPRSTTLFMGDFLSSSLHIFSLMQQMVLLSSSTFPSFSATKTSDIDALCLPIMKSITQNMNKLLSKESIPAKSLPLLLSAFYKAIQSHQYRQQHRTVSKGSLLLLQNKSTVSKAYLTKNERTVIQEILGWEISFASNNSTYYFPSRIAGIAGMIRSCVRDNQALFLHKPMILKGENPAVLSFSSVIMDIGKLWDQRHMLNDTTSNPMVPFQNSMFEDSIGNEIQYIYNQIYTQNINNIQQYYQAKIENNKLINLSTDSPVVEIDMFIPQRAKSTNKSTPKQSTGIFHSLEAYPGAIIEIDGPYHYVPFAPEEIIAANLGSVVVRSSSTTKDDTTLPLYTYDEIYDTYTAYIVTALHKRSLVLSSSRSEVEDIIAYETFWNQRRKYSDQVRNGQLQSTVKTKNIPFLSIPFWHPLLMNENNKMLGKGFRSHFSNGTNNNNSNGTVWTKELQKMLLYVLRK